MISNRLAVAAGLAVVACVLRSAELPAAPPTNSLDRGVLVLRNGKLVRGRITQTPGGFEVDVNNGRMMVPYKLVRFQATSESDAYRRLRDAAPRPTSRLSTRPCKVVRDQ